MYLITSKQGKITPKTATAVIQHINNENQYFMALKKPLFKGLSVELEGVEPSSKQVTDVLSTCLSYG